MHHVLELAVGRVGEVLRAVTHEHHRRVLGADFGDGRGQRGDHGFVVLFGVDQRDADGQRVELTGEGGHFVHEVGILVTGHDVRRLHDDLPHAVGDEALHGLVDVVDRGSVAGGELVDDGLGSERLAHRPLRIGCGNVRRDGIDGKGAGLVVAGAEAHHQYGAARRRLGGGKAHRGESKNCA